jgi:hypothetical protein
MIGLRSTASNLINTYQNEILSIVLMVFKKPETHITPLWFTFANSRIIATSFINFTITDILHYLSSQKKK